MDRQWFTFAVARDVYDGVPAIYVNYLDYDEAAHAFGPRSRHAFSGLRAVDRSLRQIRRALRRVPEHRYDLYVLSDHGQAACTPYSELTGGRRFERAFFDGDPDGDQRDREGRGSSSARSRRRRRRLASALEAGTRGPLRACASGVDLGFEPYLDVREACERDGVRVVSAGPNAFVYFLDTPEPVPLEAIEARWPGLPAIALEESRHRLRPGARRGRPRVLLARRDPSPGGRRGRPVRRTGRIGRSSSET